MLFIDDPRLLSNLEESFPFSATLKCDPSLQSTSDLATCPAYQDLLSVLRGDWSELSSNIDKMRKTWKSELLVDTMPLFWLENSETRFYLSGIVFRPDRRRRVGGTGELRLLYRLMYTDDPASQRQASSLPLVFNVIFQLPDDIHKRLLPTAHQGLLQFLRATRQSADAIEVNALMANFPGVEDKDFSAQVHYLLRAFSFRGSRLAVNRLENMPAVDLTPMQKARLKAWIKRNLNQIDLGSFVLPQEFLASKAISVSPHGNHRTSNQPFSQIFNAQDLSDLDLSGFRMFSDPDSLLLRLDKSSCVGCHQARAVAGFHFLGRGIPDREGSGIFFRPGSPHFHGIQQWRRSADRSSHEPLPDRISTRHRTLGEPCHPSAQSPSSFPCQKGLVCDVTAISGKGVRMGECSPSSGLGASCSQSVIQTHSNPLHDTIKVKKNGNCDNESFTCGREVEGFPGGICVQSCKRIGADGCVATPLFGPFTDCILLGKPFRECLLAHHRPAKFPACDRSKFCRNGYVCVKQNAKGGVCLPPYTQLQLRVTAHPELIGVRKPLRRPQVN